MCKPNAGTTLQINIDKCDINICTCFIIILIILFFTAEGLLQIRICSSILIIQLHMIQSNYEPHTCI